MVEKLNIKNSELKKSQEIALQAQQELLKANRELAAQMSQVQFQLSTVKEDIRQEFDEKMKKMLQMISFIQYPGNPTPYDHPGISSRPTKTKPPENSITSPVKKKQDMKGSPMQNPFAADNPDRDTNMKQYLLRRFDEEYNQMSMAPTANQNIVTPHDPTILPEARADPSANVG